ELLDLAFLPEEKGSTDIKANDLAAFAKKLEELMTQSNKILPVEFLQLCENKLKALTIALSDNHHEAIAIAKKALLEAIRIKTEFVGRQFVKLKDLQDACKEVLRIDAEEK